MGQNNKKMKVKGKAAKGSKQNTKEKASGKTLKKTYSTRSNAPSKAASGGEATPSEGRRKRSIKYYKKVTETKTIEYEYTSKTYSGRGKNSSEAKGTGKSTKNLVKTTPTQVNNKIKTRSSVRGRAGSTTLQSLPLKPKKRSKRKSKAPTTIQKAKRAKVDEEADSSNELKSISLRSGKKTSMVSVNPRQTKNTKSIRVKQSVKVKTKVVSTKKETSTELSTNANAALDDKQESEVDLMANEEGENCSSNGGSCEASDEHESESPQEHSDASVSQKQSLESSKPAKSLEGSNQSSLDQPMEDESKPEVDEEQKLSSQPEEVKTCKSKQSSAKSEGSVKAKSTKSSPIAKEQPKSSNANSGKSSSKDEDSSSSNDGEGEGSDSSDSDESKNRSPKASREEMKLQYYIQLFEKQAKIEERKKQRKQVREEKKNTAADEPKSSPKQKYQGKRKGTKGSKPVRKDSIKIELVNDNSTVKGELPPKELLDDKLQDKKEATEQEKKSVEASSKTSEIQNVSKLIEQQMTVFEDNMKINPLN